MSDRPFLWGEVIGIFATAGLFAWAFWAAWRRKRRRKGAAGPSIDEPYRAYDSSHDLEVSGRDVPEALRRYSPDRLNGWAMRDPEQWTQKVSAALEFERSIDPLGHLGEALRSAFNGRREGSDWAIALLIDQSGSMRDDPMLTVAGTMRWLSQRLAENNVTCAVYGFSTVGWKGGNVRRQWLTAGQPERPGRLCALLHVTYQPLGGKLGDEDWEAMLHPDILRENVDGEAIEWALGRLRERPEANRLLVVVSDGAPVDDATLTYNDPSYLERHLLSVIERAEASDDIILAAEGIGFAVDRYYRQSRYAKDLAQVPEAIVNLITHVVTSTEKSCPPISPPIARPSSPTSNAR